jgi:hypothetical protein
MLARIARLASLVFCCALPVAVVVMIFVVTIMDGTVAMDFRQFDAAAEVILRGESPYPLASEPLLPWGGPYPYPPLPALVVTPLTGLSQDVAGLLVMSVLVVTTLAIPYVLGVRDWRCYGVLLLWPAVISAIQTSNLTLPLALAAALAWRFRDRALVTSTFVGVTLAAKFVLWPLVVWYAATRRHLAAVVTLAMAAWLFVASWAVIGFAGLADYPGLLRRVEDAVAEDSYTVYVAGLDLGLSSPIARAVWLGLGCMLVAAVVLTARRGDEKSAFVYAIAAALALSPIVWLHYFALLAVVVALAQPRLGLAWFVPLLMIVTPGRGQPTPFETVWTLAVAAAALAVALRAVHDARAEPSGAVSTPLTVRAA